MFEVYETKKYVHLMLPHLDGGELFNRISSKGLYKESQAVPIMKNILSGLAYLHEDLIVHRDLKPRNVFVSNSTH